MALGPPEPVASVRPPTLNDPRRHRAVTFADRAAPTALEEGRQAEFLRERQLASAQRPRRLAPRYHPVLGVLLLPSLLLIGVFSYYPAVRSLIGGFYSWNGFSPPTYAGISQFKQYIQAPTFRPEVTNLLILTGGGI